MTQTVTIILPWLQFLAGGGSGVAASWLFDVIRARYRQNTVPAIPTWLETLLYAPRYARLTVLGLSAAISVLASLLLAWLSKGDLPAAFDAAFAAAISGVASQLMHARKLDTEPPDPAPIITYIGKPTPPPNLNPPGPITPPVPPRNRYSEKEGSAGPPRVPYVPPVAPEHTARIYNGPDQEKPA